MTSAAIHAGPSRSIGDHALKAASILWFLTAAAGQCLFVVYIFGFFGPPILRNTLSDWNKKEQLVHGHIAGDDLGNLAFGIHVMLAAILTLGGLLQLIPQIRAFDIRLHRWNGRVFLTTVVIVTAAGLFMNALRGSGDFSPAPITTNAALILIFAGATYAFARTGRIDRHHRWALRTYLVVNGVWFLRVGVFGFAAINAGLGGADAAVGQFFELWAWGSFSFPLVILDLFFLVRKNDDVGAKFAVAFLIFILTVAMGIGAIAAWMMIWAPYVAFPGATVG